MDRSVETAEHIVALPRKLEKACLTVIGMLSATILLKVAGIQYLEIIEILLFLYLLTRSARTAWRIEMSRFLLRLGWKYALFLAVAAIGVALSFTRPTYLTTARIYGLGYISISRATELVCGVTALITLAEVFRRDPRKCFFTMKVYFWTGTISGLVAIPQAILAADHRGAGFFNEGGPYGLYMISVLLVGMALRAFAIGPGRTVLTAALVFDLVALTSAASKAAFAAIAVLFIIQVAIAAGVKQRIVALGVMMLGVILVASFTNVVKGTATYLATSDSYVQLSQLRPTDYNLVVGRVAGLYFVPRMIAQHPWLGVGWGNYGLVRNAPEYRGDSVWVSVNDLPSLGLYGLAAEIGIPLTLFLIYLLFLPAAAVRRLTTWRIVANLALLQPIVHLFGAQLNLTYPWIVSAFALGIAGLQPPSRNRAV